MKKSHLLIVIIVSGLSIISVIFVILLNTTSNLTWKGVVSEPIETISSSAQVIAWSPDSQALIIGQTDGEVQTWSSVQQSDNRSLLTNRRSKVTSVALNFNNSAAMVGYENGIVTIWDIIDDDIRFTTQAHSSWIQEVSWSPNAEMVISSSNDGTILWDAIKGIQLNRIQETIPDLVWKPDSSAFVGNTTENSFITRVWNAQTASIVIDTIETGNKFALSPNGKWILGFGIWDTQTGDLAFSCDSECYVASQTFTWSKDGSRVAVGSGDSMCFEGSFYCVRDYNIRVWAVSSDPHVSILKGHIDDVIALSWYPDDTRLTSVSLDGTAIVWDTTSPSYNILKIFNLGEITYYNQIALSPDGKKVAIIDAKGKVNIFELTA